MQKQYVVIGIAVLICVIGVVIYKNGNGDTHTTATVTRGDLINAIQFSGVVSPQRRVELSFEASGRVVDIPVAVGSAVLRGSPLAQVDDNEARIAYNEALANLQQEEAALAQTQTGTREEELQVQRATVYQSEENKRSAEQALLDTLLGSYTTADNAVRNNIDTLFTDTETNQPQVIFQSTDGSLELRVENERVRVDATLESWNTMLDTLRNINRANEASHSVANVLFALLASGIAVNENEVVDFDELVVTTRSNLTQIQTFIDDVSVLVNPLSPTGAQTQATIDGWKADIDSARAEIDAALSTLSSAEKSKTHADATLVINQRQLALLEAGATDEALAIASAGVEARRAAVEAARTAINKHTIVAPFSGIVAKYDVDLGEFVSAGDTRITLDTKESFEIDADVSELDIGDIVEGALTRVVLDAFPQQEFEATVVQIDPGETIVNNIPTYGVVLSFVSGDARIRAGMTANVYLEAVTKSNVLVIPSRALSMVDEVFTVTRVTQADVEEEVVVEVGVRDSQGNVEIRSGLEVGDQILIRD